VVYFFYMAHNEDTRVKIPAILHLGRLGYKYLSLKESNWDSETNIFTDVFFDSIKKSTVMLMMMMRLSDSMKK